MTTTAELEVQVAEARERVESHARRRWLPTILAGGNVLAIVGLAALCIWFLFRISLWSDMYNEQTRVAEALREQIAASGDQPVVEPLPPAPADGVEPIPGPPGKDSTIPGPPGKDSTVPGPPGRDGKDGEDSTVPGPPGQDSTVPGPAGKDGKDGKDSTVPGPPGNDGKDGRGIASAVCDQTTAHWSITWTDGTTTDAGACIYIPADPVPTATATP